MKWRTKLQPDNGQRVLAFWETESPGGDMCVAIYACGSWSNPDNDEDDYRAPDAWMPLPEPPKP